MRPARVACAGALERTGATRPRASWWPPPPPLACTCRRHLPAPRVPRAAATLDPPRSFPTLDYSGDFDGDAGRGEKEDDLGSSDLGAYLGPPARGGAKPPRRGRNAPGGTIAARRRAAARSGSRPAWDAFARAPARLVEVAEGLVLQVPVVAEPQQQPKQQQPLAVEVHKQQPLAVEVQEQQQQALPQQKKHEQQQQQHQQPTQQPLQQQQNHLQNKQQQQQQHHKDPQAAPAPRGRPRATPPPPPPREEPPEAVAQLARLQRWGGHAVAARQVWAAAAADPVDAAALDAQPIALVNLALARLAEWRLEREVRRLARYALAREDRNEHTFAAVFGALADVGRSGEAVAAWEALAGAGVDVGPVGASAVIKACARARDADSGLRVFERMLRRRATINRYTYNAILHLCAVTARADDALAVYNLMRLETEPANLPDRYTYSALVRAVINSRRHDMARAIFENMVEDDVAADSRLACHMLTAAARAGDLRLARSVYAHALASLRAPTAAAAAPAAAPAAAAAAAGTADGNSQPQLKKRGAAARRSNGSGNGGDADSTAAAAESDAAAEAFTLSVEVVNAYLNAFASAGDFSSALRVYRRELLPRAPALAPDAFTFTALLTAAARSGVSSGLALATVEGIRAAMGDAKVRLNGPLGCALINAYRRVRGNAPLRPGEQQMAAAGAAAAAAAAAAVARVGGRAHPDALAALERARGALAELEARRQANARCYAVAAAFLLENGRVDEGRALIEMAGRASGGAADGSGTAPLGAGLDAKALDVLARAAEEGEAMRLAQELRARAEAAAEAAGGDGGDVLMV